MFVRLLVCIVGKFLYNLVVSQLKAVFMLKIFIAIYLYLIVPPCLVLLKYVNLYNIVY